MPKPAFTDAIIAGRYKGRKLLLPQTEAVRPTKNRVRQAVFNLLGSRLNWEGLTVADICCGSGAWGLEALSRGAEHAFLVDTDTAAAARNAEALGVGDSVTLIKSKAESWAPPSLLDVVLADPPYGTPIAQNLLNRAKMLSQPGAWWAIESGLEDPLKWEGFEDLSTRIYGATKVTLGRLK